MYDYVKMYRLIYNPILQMDGWMYIIFNSISVISVQSNNDSKRLCATEPLLQSKRFPPQVGFKPGTADHQARAELWQKTLGLIFIFAEYIIYRCKASSWLSPPARFHDQLTSTLFSVSN